MLKNELFDKVIEDLKAGYWKILNNPNKEIWSDTFYDQIGYPKEEIQSGFDIFLNKLLHPEDVELFRDNFLNYRNSAANFKQHIKIKHKKGNYIIFRCATNDELPVNIQSDTRLLFFFEVRLQPEQNIIKDNFYYRETAEMTSTGSWFVDFRNRKSYWDFETKKILGYPEDYIPSLRKSAEYYTEEYQQLAADLFFNCAVLGKPFQTEIKMLTKDSKELWVRAIGKPVYNDQDEIIGIRGVFQDIDQIKKKEIQLQQSIDVITSQNSRLFNFAYIVSHNLRSHTSNLSLLVALIDRIKEPDQRQELIDQLKDISHNLNTTITHLNEVVTIQTNKQQKELIRFEEILKLVTTGIGQFIKINNASITHDFNDCPEIEYIPAYLESILLNLITNAIKYKDPSRNPKINIKTCIEDNQKCLVVSDNGVGFDMQNVKDKIFGMYKTFHDHKDAVGIGLFMTKNQIESLNGSIEVDSTPNNGTTFTIRF